MKLKITLIILVAASILMQAQTQGVTKMFATYDQFNRLVIRGVLPVSFDSVNPDSLYNRDISGNVQHFEDPNYDVENFVLVNMYDRYDSTFSVFSQIKQPSPNFVDSLNSKGNLKGRLAATAFRNTITDNWNFKVYKYDPRGQVSCVWDFFLPPNIIHTNQSNQSPY